ncbi:MAG: alpha-L-rhamnosidase N-terminal domain-containing protein [Bacteroidaceae bacterium]|nr:alpha-L-rhamnosidase N-terminal domain-containing protein [Bacteroidaceae bacterium]
MKKLSSFLLALMTGMTLSAQIHLPGYNQRLISEEIMTKPWKAIWVSAANENASEFGVYHFRKTLTLNEKPDQYVIHVSADNRYKLYVNGQLASLGPARSDIKNCNFETVDIAPYLKAGDNQIAAVVWNFASQKPVAQMSGGSACFIVQGNTDAEKGINTDRSWKAIRNSAYTPNPVGYSQVLGYYAAGATEKIDASLYPWGWEQAGFDDSHWLNARGSMPGGLKGAEDSYSLPLIPSPIPQMEQTPQRLSSVRLAEGVNVPEGFLKRPVTLTVPANTQAKLLLDNSVLTTGYLSMLFSKGKDAVINIGYAESLYEVNEKGQVTRAKGNRNEVEGKKFVGYQDVITADGGSQRLFTPLWWRTWRYVQVEIETKEEPLEINDIYGTFSAYPFQLASSFKAPGNQLYDDLLEVGWRTARLCANETYMDCPYYEQLMYFGDTRIQTMLTMYNTRDEYMVKNAIEMGRHSMNNEGITLSRYPDDLGQLIPSYSLSWIGIAYDYWMMRGDEAYVKTLLPAMRSILAWYESFLKDDYSLDKIPFWYFCDWSEGFQRGVIPREDHGNSALQDLDYLMALDEVIEMENAMGIKGMADHYADIASHIRSGFNAKYWDADRQLYADTHDHRNYSQHSNILAILTGIIKGNEAKALCERILTAEGLNQATIYYQYYLHMAMDKVGCGDLLLDHISTYTDLFKVGLTTAMESPEPSRSDCHAWSASMNIEFLRTVLGVHSDAPGFSKVLITPAPGKLQEVSGSVPHPKGDILVSYKQGKKLEATVTLPQGLTGTLRYNGKDHQLKGGVNTFKL